MWYKDGSAFVRNPLHTLVRRQRAFSSLKREKFVEAAQVADLEDESWRDILWNNNDGNLIPSCGGAGLFIRGQDARDKPNNLTDTYGCHRNCLPL